MNLLSLYVGAILILDLNTEKEGEEIYDEMTRDQRLCVSVN